MKYILLLLMIAAVNIVVAVKVEGQLSLYTDLGSTTDLSTTITEGVEHPKKRYGEICYDFKRVTTKRIHRKEALANE